ncbi:M-phase inducer phosphatase [Neolecta irregularis DAH-3]|uniref:M-phase inducer phosphatase n=1 Tax=Neolecta irregularis (strain DAH-3) TaxID=1198029 RepID=A0A1U7LMN3_NEOID|nr:M-phase inducer phosphatase [Neolecta irregularis DAH-3]|eukprot:OLL23926.1 M-phase inducer phosphatase [Neolecta irregularis DAH-3]
MDASPLAALHSPHRRNLPRLPAAVSWPALQSPTASLAADLSANLHIDSSPVVPTPRRSLLPSLALRPPDSMDIDFDLSPCHASLDRFLRSSTAHNRKLSHRPSMTRLKATSFFAPTKPAPETPAVFRAAASRPQQLPASFRYPPGKENAPVLAHLYGDSSSDSPSSYSAHPDPNESPLANIKPDKSLSRFRPPRFRRTQSMFQRPGDIVAATPTPTISQPVSFSSPKIDDNPDGTILPCFNVKEDQLKRIDHNTFVDVLNGVYSSFYDELKVIDCRFPYEYDGGHVQGAININTQDSLDDALLSHPANHRTLLIFHCEYSAHRAPRMYSFLPYNQLKVRALHLRNRDRHVNMHRYPRLFYPEIYVLAGGYSQFFTHHKSRCEPQNYVEMGDHSHKQTCAKEMHAFKKNLRFFRTNSFTFGAADKNSTQEQSAWSNKRPTTPDQTPTAPSKSSHYLDPHQRLRGEHPKRMTSY